LLQLNAICQDERQVIRKPAVHPNTITLHFGLSQSDGLADRLVDV
jgi:hypothetical protein